MQTGKRGKRTQTRFLCPSLEATPRPPEMRQEEERCAPRLNADAARNADKVPDIDMAGKH